MRSFIGFLLMISGAGLLILKSANGMLGMVQNFFVSVFLIWGVVLAFELDKLFWGKQKFDPHDQNHYGINQNKSRWPPGTPEEARDPLRLDL